MDLNLLQKKNLKITFFSINKSLFLFQGEKSRMKKKRNYNIGNETISQEFSAWEMYVYNTGF